MHRRIVILLNRMRCKGFLLFSFSLTVFTSLTSGNKLSHEAYSIRFLHFHMMAFLHTDEKNTKVFSFLLYRVYNWTTLCIIFCQVRKMWEEVRMKMPPSTFNLHRLLHLHPEISSSRPLNLYHLCHQFVAP